MSKFRKVTAVLLSVVMFVCCFAVQASAASVFDGAKKIGAADAVSHSFKDGLISDTDVLYKIVLNDSGKITFYCSDYSCISISLLNSSGGTEISKGEDYLRLDKEYEITKKGTYYIRLEKRTLAYTNTTKHYYKNFYYGFQPDHTPTISFALNVKVGDELDFSALASNYTGKVTYKTTDSKVATVDKGKVTCKKAGKAKIRAYMNNGDYAEITLVVKKK